MELEKLYDLAGVVWWSGDNLWGWSRYIEKEDAVQSAVAHCWTVRDSFRPREDGSRNGERYYWQLVMRRHIHHLVDKRRRQRRNARREVSSEVLIEHADPGPTPYRLAEHRDDLRALDEAVRKLPEPLELAVACHLGRIPRESLGVSRQRVDQRLTRAREIIRRTLAASGALC